MKVVKGKLGSISASVRHSSATAITNADDPMASSTSILKDIAEDTIPKNSTVPKCFNKPWFSDTYNDVIKERATGPSRGSNVHHPRVL